MRCTRCQQDNPVDAVFCQECGSRLEAVCPSCGTGNQLAAKFCKKCGQRLAGDSGAPVEQRFAAPETYTPKHLAEKILTSKAALEGERKQVTVLFADLKGSMELLADRDPEEGRNVLDPVLERMMEAVHQYEGTVNQVMGDGIMALFGAPVAHEDHAARACYAALRMQAAVKRHGEDVFRSHGVAVEMRVGLNSGEVVVRSVGSDLRMDYTAVGQTTHLAARMEQLARPGTILLTSHTLELVEGLVEVKARGPVPVKGLREPIEVYEVTGAGPVRSRFEATTLRGLTRFVGRESELEQLRKALELAARSHGQIVAVVGEPGVGKSRLFFEFTRSHRTQGWLVLESGSVSYGKTTAFLPVVQLLKGYFQIEIRDEARRIREKVMGKLLSLDRALEPFLPALLWLLDVRVDEPRWERLDPPHRRLHALDAVKRLLHRESHVQPVLLLVEDLHWIDSETQALLDSLVESLPTARLLLLVNYRPEYQHPWGSKTYYRRLLIEPLAAESAHELLSGLLGGDASLEPLKRLLIEQTEGNPFFLEETVRTLVEARALTGERGAYRLARLVEAIQVPPTVQAVLATRIDRLPPEEKRLLQTAAVIGHEVPFALLPAIVELPDAALRRSLAHLQSAEFLYETRLFPDLEYTFKHALTHEVAYASLLQDRRRGLHARIVEAIEELYSDPTGQHVEQLAHHAFRGEVWDKAVGYLRQTGANAMRRSTYREAVTSFETALVALQHLPETRATLEQAIDLRFDLRTSLFPLGHLHRVREYLEQAEGLTRKLDDQRRRGWMSAFMCHYRWVTGHPAEARKFGESAHAIATALDDFPLKVAAHYYLGLACLTGGAYREAADFLGRNVASLSGDVGVERSFGVAGFPAPMSRSYLAWALAALGAFEEGVVQGEAGLRVAQELNHAWTLVTVSWGVGSLRLLRGEFDAAIVLLERALPLSRDWNLTALSPAVAASLGYAYAMTGRVADGLALLEDGVAATEASGRLAVHALGLAYLGEACLLADRLDDAAGVASRARALARERGQPGDEAWALRLLGEVASHRGPGDAASAERHYRAALGLATDLAMRPLVAHCHLGLGRLYGRAGDRTRAQEHRGAAVRMYREMGMGSWVERGSADSPG